jgi:molybdopterin-containing oxidoreductase family iron-sulfur binding subunit
MGENYQPPIPDGFFQTACQQACPSDAIVFGDVLDQASRVNEMRETQRTYALLGYLNTRPRTTHMIRVRNPNPAVGVYDEHDPLHHGGGHEGGEEGDHGETAWVDPRRRGETGYRASLKVMG